MRDCYGALGVIHSIWKPIPGRFKDYIAMPKFNMYQSLHTTVMSNEGKLLEIQIRTSEMDTTAEFGIAAHWMYKHGLTDRQVDRLTWLKSMMEWQKETTDASGVHGVVEGRARRRRGLRLYAEGRRGQPS